MGLCGPCVARLSYSSILFCTAPPTDRRCALLTLLASLNQSDSREPSGKEAYVGVEAALGCEYRSKSLLERPLIIDQSAKLPWYMLLNSKESMPPGI